MIRRAGLLAVLFSLLVGSVPVRTQSQSAASGEPSTASQSVNRPALRFEVASVRLRQSSENEPSNRRVLPGGRFVATGTTVRTLIRIALGTDDNRMSHAPGWIDNETFDIVATTANHAEIATPWQFQQLILSLLEDRFQFKFHTEQKAAHVYWLELDRPGKLGPALKPSNPDSQPSMSTDSNGFRAVMKVSKMSMTDIAAALARQAGRPVEDHTGVKGDFDFQIEWAPDETSDSADPSLFTVLRQQLGLKLQSANGTVETFIIDRITQPTAN